MNNANALKDSTGFSLTELSLSLAIISILAAIAIPNVMQMLYANRVSSDARGLARQFSLARERAGSDFTWTQIVIDGSTTPVSYTLQVCTTKAISSCTAFTTEGGTQYFFSGTTLGFGSSSGAAGAQITRAQTSTVTFNSRGIPIDDTGSPTANDTVYLADGLGNACAVSVTLSGHTNLWRYNGGWGSL